MSECLDTFAPPVEKTIVIRPLVPWFSEELKVLKKDKRRKERIMCSKNTHENLEAYHTSRNVYVKCLNDTKTKYYSEKIESAKGDQKALFNIVSLLSQTNKDTILPETESAKTLADDFKDFFVTKVEKIRRDIQSKGTPSFECTSSATVPLEMFSELTTNDVIKMVKDVKNKQCRLDPIPTKILKQNITILAPTIRKMVNLSLLSGCFAEKWKEAIVTPLQKKVGSDTSFSNYRPVSNLALISKLTEKAVITQVNNHMRNHCPLPDCQSAYRVFHSTETALLKIQCDILLNMDKKQLTLLVAIDMSAAFDLVDHDIMLKVLTNKFGVIGSARNWFASYLQNRSFSVNIRGTDSEPHVLDCSVPQGSCLGPQLFTQYASTLFEAVHNYLPQLHGYADDHMLYMSYSSDLEEDSAKAITSMQDCLTSVKEWMLQNKLKMNDAKTEFIIIGTKQQLAKTNVHSIMVGETQVHATDCIRSLGVFLDKHMSMKHHINAKIRTAHKHLYRIHCIRKYLTQDATECLIHAFVTSQLDYGNSLLYGIPKTELSKFQRVQNQAAKLVVCARKYDRVTPIMLQLHWLPVEQRVIFKIALLIFKVLHSMAPVYLSDVINIKPRALNTVLTKQDGVPS
jgi:hypothetical protein